MGGATPYLDVSRSTQRAVDRHHRHRRRRVCHVGVGQRILLWRIGNLGRYYRYRLYKDDGEVRTTGERAFIENPDMLPYPERRLLAIVTDMKPLPRYCRLEGDARIAADTVPLTTSGKANAGTENLRRSWMRWLSIVRDGQSREDSLCR